MGDIPITEETDENLSNNDTADLKVGDRLNPGLVTGLVLGPTVLPDSVEKWCQVANREKNVTGTPVSIYHDNLAIYLPLET